MFVIIRNNNGTTKTLKDSNSHLDKTFNDFSTAQLLVQKLNQHTDSSTRWSVKKHNFNY